MKIDVIVMDDQTKEQAAADEVSATLAFHSNWEEQGLECISAKGYPTKDPNTAKVVILLRQFDFTTGVDANTDANTRVTHVINEIEPLITDFNLALIDPKKPHEFSLMCKVPYEINE